MNRECLKLTAYLGERDRADGGFLADALTDVYARHELQASILLRGVEGFGVKHALRSDRILTLSEDLPLVSVAVDSRARIKGALEEIDALPFQGLLTLERVRLLSGRTGEVVPADELREATKLTAYIGRQERVGGRPAYEVVVDAMHRTGVAGATVLLGIDGTAHGVRRRARFFGRNAEVPLMVIAVGEGERIAAALGEIAPALQRPLMTLERVRVCKRDGRKLAEPRHVPAGDSSGLGLWSKLMIYSGEQSRHAGRPLSSELIRALRSAGASGATSLRGVWGYHGEHRPHGDSFRQLRRRVPVVTVVADTPERMRRWFEIVDEITDETGLVTSEVVPALQTISAGVRRGGLRLAEGR